MPQLAHMYYALHRGVGSGLRVVRDKSKEDQENRASYPTGIGECERLGEDPDPDQYGNSVEQLHHPTDLY